jgi:hypothetical protein
VERVCVLWLRGARRGSRAAVQTRAELELSEDGNDVRLVYSDDPRLRGSGIFGAWLTRTELEQAQQRAIVRAAVETGKDVTITGQTAAGDTSRLRGLPAIGRGVAGAMNGTDPLRSLLKKERRAADRGISEGE